MSQALITRHNNGGYSKGDTIEIDKLQPVYEEKIDLSYTPYVFNTLSSLNDNNYISLVGDVLYSLSDVYEEYKQNGNVVLHGWFLDLYSSDGNDISRIWDHAISRFAGFDTDGNLYLSCSKYNSDKGYVDGYYLSCLKKDGTMENFTLIDQDIYPIFCCKVIGDYLYCVQSYHDDSTGSFLCKYSISTKKLINKFKLEDFSSNYRYRDLTIDEDENIYLTRDNNMYKYSSTGTKIWGVSKRTSFCNYTDGYVYYCYGEIGGDIPPSPPMDKLERISSNGIVDTKWNSSDNIYGAAHIDNAFLFGKKYLKLCGGKTYISDDGSTSSYSDTYEKIRLLDLDTMKIYLDGTGWLVNNNRFIKQDKVLYYIPLNTIGYKVLD